VTDDDLLELRAEIATLQRRVAALEASREASAFDMLMAAEPADRETMILRRVRKSIFERWREEQ
jgi:hypothetical protein